MWKYVIKQNTTKLEKKNVKMKTYSVEKIMSKEHKTVRKYKKTCNLTEI